VKTAILPVALVFVLASAGSSVSLSDRMPDRTSEKIPQHSDPGVPDGREGGETIPSARHIVALPFHDTGNTSDNINNYDEVCPYTGSTAPDVVYSYMPMEDTGLSISLCDSYYDTKLYVYEDTWTPGSPLACNDDAFNCMDPPVAYTSSIEYLPVRAGHEYYIVVDGYEEECGDYVLDVSEFELPQIDCEGTPEGEPTCYYNYVDHYNGGCDSTPNAFIFFHQNMHWCGGSGVYDTDSGTYRDTDWYLCCPCGRVTLTIEAQFGVVFGFVDVDNCNQPAFIDYEIAPPGVLSTLTREFEYSFLDVAVFVAPSDWLPQYECGCEYSLDVDGDCFVYWVPVESTSWGAVKALYR
jgi:hypothetical protein